MKVYAQWFNANGSRQSGEIVCSLKVFWQFLLRNDCKLIRIKRF